jgi:hypothetical protein
MLDGVMSIVIKFLFLYCILNYISIEKFRQQRQCGSTGWLISIEISIELGRMLIPWLWLLKTFETAGVNLNQ